jgi:hypothetical protein
VDGSRLIRAAARVAKRVGRYQPSVLRSSRTSASGQGRVDPCARRYQWPRLQPAAALWALDTEEEVHYGPDCAVLLRVGMPAIALCRFWRGSSVAPVPPLKRGSGNSGFCRSLHEPEGVRRDVVRVVRLDVHQDRHVCNPILLLLDWDQSKQYPWHHLGNQLPPKHRWRCGRSAPEWPGASAKARAGRSPKATRQWRGPCALSSCF